MDETDALARSLQASLLPPRLPHVPGIDIVARYAPAGSGAEVVGDFYDVFEMGRDCWGIAIGDVCGKGVEAAKVTALARHTIRAVALTETRPDRVLALLNRAMLTGDLPESLFLSAQFAALTPGNLSLCSAGHPPPLLRRASGEVEEVAVSGTLLGLVEDPKLSVTDIPLGPGDALVLHTDGVTEARGADVFGTEGLIAVLASAPPGAEAIADRIESAVRAHSGPTLADDMAVLVIRPT